MVNTTVYNFLSLKKWPVQVNLKLEVVNVQLIPWQWAKRRDDRICNPVSWEIHQILIPDVCSKGIPEGKALIIWHNLAWAGVPCYLHGILATHIRNKRIKNNEKVFSPMPDDICTQHLCRHLAYWPHHLRTKLCIRSGGIAYPSRRGCLYHLPLRQWLQAQAKE